MFAVTPRSIAVENVRLNRGVITDVTELLFMMVVCVTAEAMIVAPTSRSMKVVYVEATPLLRVLTPTFTTGAFVKEMRRGLVGVHGISLRMGFTPAQRVTEMYLKVARETFTPVLCAMDMPQIPAGVTRG